MAKAKANSTPRKVGKRATPKAGMRTIKTKNASETYSVTKGMFKTLSAKAEAAGVKPKKFIDEGLKKLAGI